MRADSDGWPTPQTPSLVDTPSLRWGVAGAARIAHDWVDALHRHTGQRVDAVAARDAGRADAFARRHSIPRFFGGYDALADDPEIDIVYIATINEQHAPVALRMIAAGKHVLVEKPLAATATQARAIAQAARAAGVYAMEAMWTKFLPQTLVIDALIADGALGELQVVTAEFSSVFDPIEVARVFAPTVGAGALLDIGVYPLAFAQHLLGRPTDLAGVGALTDLGIDRRAIVTARHPGDALSVCSTALDIASPNSATIVGSAGRIEFRTRFYQPADFTLTVGDDVRTWRPDPAITGRGGLCYAPVAAAADILAGRTESARHGLDAAISVLDTIDSARAKLGVTAVGLG